MKKYQLIYTDPPWFYNKRNVGSKTRFGGGIYTHYPPMKNAELFAMRPMIDALADTNCLLPLWVTGPKLTVGIELIHAWGFRYAAIGYVWVKTYKNGKVCICPGHYTSNSVELVLFGMRGSMPPCLRLRPQVYCLPRREHSRKPDEIRKALEESYPEANKIELFARQRSPGWDVYGNETDKFKEPPCGGLPLYVHV